MNEEQKQEYVDLMIEGNLPNQETFTKEEAKYLTQTALTWASQQIEHKIGELLHDDIPNLVANCEYKTIEEGIKDVEEDFENQLLETVDFIENHLN
ncbi:MAG: hypothetical protein WC917_03705 [Bacilli bacterium]|jgi:hypothetical protein